MIERALASLKPLVQGKERVLPCPVCDQGTAKRHLWINPSIEKGQCFKCGEKMGDGPSILAFVFQIPIQQAVDRWVRDNTRADKIQGVCDKLRQTQSPGMVQVVNSQKSVQLPREYRAIDSARDVPVYARRRGLRLQDCLRYGLGVCYEGYYRDRLIVPIFSVRMRLVSFVARDMTGKAERKVLYPPGSVMSQVLFNEAEARHHKVIIVCEGVFDAMRFGEAGTCLFGKQASKAQIERLLHLGLKRRLVIMLDRDAQDEAYQLARGLSRCLSDVRLARLPDHIKDPGECSEDQAWDVAAHAKPFGHRLDRLKGMLQRLQAQV